MKVDKSSKEKRGVLGTRILLYTFILQGQELVHTKPGLF